MCSQVAGFCTSCLGFLRCGRESGCREILDAEIGAGRRICGGDWPFRTALVFRGGAHGWRQLMVRATAAFVALCAAVVLSSFVSVT